jgi:hypothetical protein
MHPQERLFRDCLIDLINLAARVESNENRPSAAQISGELQKVHDRLLSLLDPPPDESQAPVPPAITPLDPPEPVVLPSTDQNGQTTVAEDTAHVESAGAEGEDGGQPVVAAGHVSGDEEA